MEQTVNCLLMVQKFMNLQQKILRLFHNLYLGNVSKVFSASNTKKTGFNGYTYDFSVDYDATAVSDILDIHKYLMKKTKYYKNVQIREANTCFSNNVFWL